MDEVQIPPRVTALIHSRNRIDALRRCLAAIERSQDRARIEVIVVDSGSRDGSALLDQEFPAAQFLRLAKNFGLNRALNIGTRTAKGDLLFLLSEDAEVEPATIPRLADHLESSDRIGAVCPWVESVRRLPDAGELWRSFDTGDMAGSIPVDPAAEEVDVEYPAGAPLMLRRKFLQGMNYIDKRFTHYWIDAEICYQLRSGGKRIVVLPQIRLERNPDPGRAMDDPIHAADLALGGAAYLGKHGGGGFGFRLRAIWSAIARMLTFRRPGFQARLLGALVTGQRVDGTQE